MVHKQCKYPLMCSCPDCIKKAYKELVNAEKKEKLEKRRQELLDKQVIVPCRTCGNKRKLPVSRAKIYRYCSKPCMNIGMKKKRKGKMWYEYSK